MPLAISWLLDYSRRVPNLTPPWLQQFKYQIPMNTASLHPIIKWAQRKNKIFIEVGLRDIQDQNVNLTPTTIAFTGESAGKKYAFNVELLEEVVPEASKWEKNGFHMNIVLDKKDKTKGYWTRLTKQPAKSQYIQCDWSKWIDEDEEQEEGSKGLSGINPESMNNFNDSDSDDEKPKLDDLQTKEEIEAGKQPGVSI